MKSELGCRTEIFVHTSPKRFNSQDGRDLSAATQWYPDHVIEPNISSSESLFCFSPLHSEGKVD